MSGSVDPLLLSRLGTLASNIERVDEALSRLRAWDGDLHGGGAGLGLRDDLWHNVDFQIRRRLRWQLAEVHRLHDRALTAGADGSTDGWSAYASLHRESSALFDECLEFIGGVAFRRTGLDERGVLEL